MLLQGAKQTHFSTAKLVSRPDTVWWLLDRGADVMSRVAYARSLMEAGIILRDLRVNSPPRVLTLWWG